MSEFVLYGRPGWGSAIIEAQLACYELPFRYVDTGDLFDSEDARSRLRPLNSLTQVPVLQLPSGQVMTESAAITLHLADITGSDLLVPGPQSAERASFLRWLVFLVANIYPTFTYSDVPERFVTDETAQTGFRDQVDTHQRRLWTLVEGDARSPYFLGERFSALDIYLAVMTRWRPGPDWFSENAPMVDSCSRRAADRPALAPLLARNFPPQPPSTDTDS